MKRMGFAKRAFGFDSQSKKKKSAQRSCKDFRLPS